MRSKSEIRIIANVYLCTSIILISQRDILSFITGIMVLGVSLLWGWKSFDNINTSSKNN